jgi:hypothetical protein
MYNMMFNFGSVAIIESGRRLVHTRQTHANMKLCKIISQSLTKSSVLSSSIEIFVNKHWVLPIQVTTKIFELSNLSQMETSPTPTKLDAKDTVQEFSPNGQCRSSCTKIEYTTCSRND